MSNPTQQSLLVPASQVGSDGRPVLATLIGADYSARAITPQRSDLAPNVVRTRLERLAPYEATRGIDIGGAWCVADHGDAGARNASTWEDAFTSIGTLAARAHSSGAFVIGLGGDHSVSWPLIATARQGALARYGPEAKVGVIQLDVHHDVRPLDQGASNGTPMRGLIESGVVDPRHLVQIGIHPFGNRRELTQYCDQQGILRFSLDDVAEEGVELTARRALQALRDVDAVYLTVDIDVLDRAFAPGTGASLPGGLDPRTLFRLVEAIAIDPRTIAMDVVEFDPERDVADTTVANVALVVMTALASIARRSAPAGKP